VFPAHQVQRLETPKSPSYVVETPPQPTYVAPPGPAVASSRAYLTIAVDRLTNCQASPQTPTERIVWLQVPEGRLSEYQCNR